MPTSTINSIVIRRLASPSKEVYDYALAAYRTLFGHMIPADRIPEDLSRMREVFCTDGVDGTFFVARETPGSASTANANHSSQSDAISHEDLDQGPSQGAIVGIIAYRPFVFRFYQSDGAPREQLQYDTRGQRTVEVTRLFVSPSHRGAGLAGRLINTLIAHAKDQGVEIMYLHTQPFLPGAEQLWVKKGWEVTVREEDGVWDTIHMEKRLR